MKKMVFSLVLLVLSISINNLATVKVQRYKKNNFIQSIASKYEDENVKISDISFINIYNDVQDSNFSSEFAKNINLSLDLRELQSIYYSPYFEIDNVYTSQYYQSWIPNQAVPVYLQLICENIITIFEYMIIISVAIDIAHYYAIHNNPNRIKKIIKSFNVINNELKKILNVLPLLDYSSPLISKDGSLAQLVNNDIYWNKIIIDYQNQNFSNLLEKYRNFDYLTNINENFDFINGFLLSAFEKTKYVTPKGADQNLDSTLANNIKLNIKSLLDPSKITIFNLNFNMKFNTDFYTYAGSATDKLKFYQPANFDIAIN